MMSDVEITLSVCSTISSVTMHTTLRKALVTTIMPRGIHTCHCPSYRTIRRQPGYIR